MKVKCEVIADPADIEFMWEFNNSGENLDIAPITFDGNNGSTSELLYTPVSERDYGTLTCWGKNSIGKQESPCIYQVIPAGKYVNNSIVRQLLQSKLIDYQFGAYREDLLKSYGQLRMPRIIQIHWMAKVTYA